MLPLRRNRSYPPAERKHPQRCRAIDQRQPHRLYRIPLPANALVVYTDGAGPESWWGRQTAGWGFTVVTGGNGDDDAAAVETHSRCGHVVTDTKQPGYIGAERPSSNTAVSLLCDCAGA